MSTLRSKVVVGLFTAIVSLAAAPARAQSAADVQYWDTSWAAYQALEAIPLPQRAYVTATTELSIVINASRPKVFDIYGNVYNALGYHPFLSGITAIRCSHDTFDFTALENIPLPDGTIYPGQTVTRQRFDRPKKYQVDTFDLYTLQGFSIGVVTHQAIAFSREKGGGTKVVETLTFEAPQAFIDLAQQGGTYAHYVVQQAVKARIEAHAVNAIKFPRYVPIRCGCQKHHDHRDDDRDDGDDEDRDD